MLVYIFSAKELWICLLGAKKGAKKRAKNQRNVLKKKLLLEYIEPPSKPPNK